MDELKGNLHRPERVHKVWMRIERETDAVEMLIDLGGHGTFVWMDEEAAADLREGIIRLVNSKRISA
jgi:hypothetical protein